MEDDKPDDNYTEELTRAQSQYQNDKYQEETKEPSYEEQYEEQYEQNYDNDNYEQANNKYEEEQKTCDSSSSSHQHQHPPEIHRSLSEAQPSSKSPELDSSSETAQAISILKSGQDFTRYLPEDDAELVHVFYATDDDGPEAVRTGAIYWTTDNTKTKLPHQRLTLFSISDIFQGKQYSDFQLLMCQL